jgi:hypothetical protein
MYKCKGIGAETALRSRWTKELTAQEAQPFLDKSFINTDAWIRPSAEPTLKVFSQARIIWRIQIHSKGFANFCC